MFPERLGLCGLGGLGDGVVLLWDVLLLPKETPPPLELLEEDLLLENPRLPPRLIPPPLLLPPLPIIFPPTTILLNLLYIISSLRPKGKQAFRCV